MEPAPDLNLGAILFEYTQPFILFLASIALGGLRLLGVMLFFPLFTWAQLSQGMRAALAFCLSMPNIYFVFYTAFYGQPPTFGELIILGAKEVLFGILLGLLIGAPFFVIQTAGDVLDLYRGASASNLFDPVNASQSSLLGQALSYMSLVVFVIAGGVIAVLELVYASYSVWPVFQLEPNLEIEMLTRLGYAILQSLAIGLLIVLPLMTAMILTDITLLFITRAAQQINIYDISILARNMVIFLIAAPYFTFFLYSVSDTWEPVFNILRELAGLMNPQTEPLE